MALLNYINTFLNRNTYINKINKYILHKQHQTGIIQGHQLRYYLRQKTFFESIQREQRKKTQSHNVLNFLDVFKNQNHKKRTNLPILHVNISVRNDYMQLEQTHP